MGEKHTLENADESAANLKRDKKGEGKKQTTRELPSNLLTMAKKTRSLKKRAYDTRETDQTGDCPMTDHRKRKVHEDPNGEQPH